MQWTFQTFLELKVKGMFEDQFITMFFKSMKKSKEQSQDKETLDFQAMTIWIIQMLLVQLDFNGFNNLDWEIKQTVLTSKALVNFKRWTTLPIRNDLKGQIKWLPLNGRTYRMNTEETILQLKKLSFLLQFDHGNFWSKVRNELKKMWIFLSRTIY